MKGRKYFLLALGIGSIFTIAACRNSNVAILNNQNVIEDVDVEAKEKELQEIMSSLILKENGRVIDDSIELPSRIGPSLEYKIEWESNNPLLYIHYDSYRDINYVTINYGELKKKEEIVLTATITSNDIKVAKEFRVKIVPLNVFDFAEKYGLYLNGITSKEQELKNSYDINGAMCEVSWECDNSDITIINRDGKYFVKGKVSYERIPVILKAKITYKGRSTTLNIRKDLYELANVQNTSRLMENNIYKLGLEQGKLDNKYLFMTGEIDEVDSKSYAKTSGNLDEAVDGRVEEVNGGYHVYIMKNDTKLYLNATDKKVTFDAEAKTVYTFNESYYTLTYKYNDNEYFLGTYNQYTTIGAYPISYIDSNFYLKFYSYF